MASQASFQLSLYAAEKAFVRAYSRALPAELRGTGVTVTTVCPGWVRTDLLERECGGRPIHFPGLAEPGPVVQKALRDAKNGRDMSVYGAYVKYMHLLARIFPHRLVMNSWLRQIKKYL